MSFQRQNEKSCQLKIKWGKKKTKIPFLRTSNISNYIMMYNFNLDIHMNKRKNSLTPFFNKDDLIKTVNKCFNI